MKKLFPNLVSKIKHEEVSTPLATVNPVETVTSVAAGNVSQTKKYYFEKPNSISDEDFLVCALLDQRGSSDATKNDIYFKSEVVVRDKEWGWALWSGLSTAKGSSTTTHMEYRLLLFKKNGNTWDIDKGFGWSGPKQANTAANNYVVIRSLKLEELKVEVPTGDWKNIYVGKGNYSSRQVWSAIAKVDKNTTTTDEDDDDDNKHLVNVLKIHMKEKNGSNSFDSEFFGSGGSWTGGPTDGFESVDKYYEKDKGWKTITTPVALGDTLTRWYGVMRKNLKWMTCDQWARGQGKDINDWEATMKEMCYSQPTS